MTDHPGTRGYRSEPLAFIEANEALSFHEVQAAFLPFIPQHACQVLDVGCGSGRDAGALAELGHSVVAVEPVDEFLVSARQRHTASSIQWINDALPELAELTDTGLKFDFVLVSAVWHHLDAVERERAMARLSSLCRQGAVLALSLRQGPAGIGTRCFPCTTEDTERLADQHSLSTELVLTDQPSLIPGKPDVSWSKLVFRRR